MHSDVKEGLFSLILDSRFSVTLPLPFFSSIFNNYPSYPHGASWDMAELNRRTTLDSIGWSWNHPEPMARPGLQAQIGGLWH